MNEQIQSNEGQEIAHEQNAGAIEGQVQNAQEIAHEQNAGAVLDHESEDSKNRGEEIAEKPVDNGVEQEGDASVADSPIEEIKEDTQLVVEVGRIENQVTTRTFARPSPNHPM